MLNMPNLYFIRFNAYILDLINQIIIIPKFRNMGKKNRIEKGSKTSHHFPSESLTTPVEHSFEERRQQDSSRRQWSEFDQTDLQDETAESRQGETDKVNKILQDLISKNKINTRNAFEVPLINISDLRGSDSTHQTYWTEISHSLENSSKVYGFRVDSVGDSITRIEDSIRRSSQITERNERPQGNKPQIFQECCFDSYSSCRENNLDQYLDKQKLMSEQKCQQMRQSPILRDQRRLLDQSSLQAILINNLPITKQLNLEIVPNQTYNQRQIQSEIFQYELPSIKQLLILDKINQIFLQVGSQIQNQEDIEAELRQISEGTMFFFPDYHSFVSSHQNEHSALKAQKISIDLNLSIQVHRKESLTQTKKSKERQRATSSTAGRSKKPRGKKNKEEIIFEEFLVEDKEEIFKKKANQKKKELIFNVQKLHNQNIQNVIVPEIKLQFESENRELQKCEQKSNVGQNIGILQNPEFYSENQQTNQTRIQTPNIKEIKNRMGVLLEPFSQISLEKLHAKFQAEFGPLSESIGFLTILHLCNERNIQMIEQPEYCPQIFNQNNLEEMREQKMEDEEEKQKNEEEENSYSLEMKEEINDKTEELPFSQNEESICIEVRKQV